MWKRLTDGTVALGLVLLALAVAHPARAFEFDLPGERKANINGFYELRLQFLGEDLPSEGITFSQFRHVLDIETEIEIFPEGWGPFDFMMAFTRVVFTYECIYQRACGTSNKADSFGGDLRSLKRLPKNLKEATNQPLEVGGVFPIRFRPGTLLPVQQELNPTFRFRDCFLPPGDVALNHPNPILGAFCNLEDRGRLDEPTDNFANTSPDLPTRAGFVSPLFNFNYLRAARPVLEAQPAQGAGTENRFRELRSLLLGGSVLSPAQLGIFRALSSAAAISEATGKSDEAEALRAEAAELVEGTFNDPAIAEELLATRPDSNIFQTLAGARAPSLLTALWGSSGLKDINLTYLASLGTAIEPLGYFGQGALDLVPHYAPGLAKGVATVRDAPLLPGIGNKQLSLTSVPFLVGPDGILNSPDDLPSVVTDAFGKLKVGPPTSNFGASDFDDVVSVALGSTSVELYGRFKRDVVLNEGLKVGCRAAGGTFDTATGTCTNAQVSEEQAFSLGCRALNSNGATGGINQDLDANGNPVCIQLVTELTSVPFRALDPLGDLTLRPQDATLEPVDLTDFQLFAQSAGQGPPARPRNPGGGLYFQHRDLQRLVAKSSRLVSSLDSEFSEDRLRWGWGANEDEGAFREGYLEFEMLDSQIFARVGKLILVWGKTELFRNQDRLNPLDLSNGVITKLEESRIGQWMANIVFSPEAWMRVGPVEDLRLELAVIFDDFQPLDLGVCGENSSLALICLKSFGAMASGLAGLGLAGEVRPDREYGGLKRFDYGVRIEGRWERFTFAITDFWGWDDLPFLQPVVQYGRRVDPETGAPVNSSGPLDCHFRTKVIEGETVVVGPDAIPGTADDIFPSVGNCLLWDNPGPTDGKQTIRAASAVALNHSVNQTLFHSVCTFTFDPDKGFCPLDQLNHPAFFPFVSSVLVGETVIGGLAIDGVSRIRVGGSPFSNQIPDAKLADLVFKSTAKTGTSQDLGNLTVEQQALLGCGPSFASPCGSDQKVAWVDPSNEDNSIAVALQRDLSTISGGPDLMNADGSVITQEFTLLKEGSPGALVGMRTAGAAQFFDAGISTGGMSVNEVIALGNDGRNEFVRQQNEIARRNALDPNDPEFLDPAEQSPVATDAWIEPFPWLPDPELLAQGVLVYQVANRFELDPRCHLSDDPELAPLFDPANPACEGLRDAQGNRIPGKKIFNDPFDRTNPLNVFRTDPDGNVIGETCIPVFGSGFDAGCTQLEEVTANLERLMIALEIVGEDRAPDPPETLEELVNVLSDNFQLIDGTLGGDPIAGPDGIFVANYAAGLGELVDPARFEDPIPGIEVAHTDLGEADVPVVRLLKEGVTTLDLRTLDSRESFMSADAVAGCVPGKPCFAILDDDVPLPNSAIDPVFDRNDPSKTVPLVVALPAAVPIKGFLAPDPNAPGLVDPNTAEPAPAHLNYIKLQFEDKVAAMELLDTRSVGDVDECFNRVLDPFSADFTTNLRIVEIDGKRFCVQLATELNLFAKDGELASGGKECSNLDNDAMCDLDQDRDGVWDGADDYTAGPATDDNILCGSGIPGDVLQDALQKEFVRPTDEAAFQALFPNGMPPRSPVFCRTSTGLLNATGLTLPIRKAGGDGQYGRRDFIWQGGRQVTLNYQKRNVFGFSLDFAEDVTKTSWGIEFTWTADKLFSDLNSFSGLHRSDEMVLSISVDRPTFFNFLNPNRSFFLNFQFFIRYLTDFTGGSDDKDGMFGVAEGPIDGRAVFTFFTGYFQDRLQPRASFVYDPTTSNGAVLAQLLYRWTEAFSTTIGLNSFFGRPEQVQQAAFPIALRTGTADTTTEALTRSLAPVRNRDSGWITVRYSW
ncbi:MAG: hypothetical protein ACE5FG_07735 [Myxococcota bacterium]